jgi:hypothetical protein
MEVSIFPLVQRSLGQSRHTVQGVQAHVSILGSRAFKVRENKLVTLRDWSCIGRVVVDWIGEESLTGVRSLQFSKVQRLASVSDIDVAFTRKAHGRGSSTSGLSSTSRTSSKTTLSAGVVGHGNRGDGSSGRGCRRGRIVGGDRFRCSHSRTLNRRGRRSLNGSEVDVLGQGSHKAGRCGGDEGGAKHLCFRSETEVELMRNSCVGLEE